MRPNRPIPGLLTATRASLALLLLAGGMLACDSAAGGEEAPVASQPSPRTEPPPHGAPAGEPADAPAALRALLEGYETVRLALLDDHLEGVAEAAVRIRSSAEALAADPTSAGVPAEQVPEVKALLPSLIAASKDLALATDLPAARTSLWTLTESLLKYRDLAGSGFYPVAYCPMARKSWLQPEGEIGNPYYGQSMATCGAFVEPKEGA